MASHSSILAWRIPWTEQPGGLQSMGSHRVRLTNTNFMSFSLGTLFLCQLMRLYAAILTTEDWALRACALQQEKPPQ